MAKKSDSQSVPQPEAAPQDRIHRKEFLFSVTDMTETQKAGFIAFVGSKVLMRPEEWSSQLSKYRERELS